MARPDPTLEELYESVRQRGKVTPAVFTKISSKEDFSTIQQQYCELACTLPCKDYNTHANRIILPTDVVVLFPARRPDKPVRNKSTGKVFKIIPGDREDIVFERILDHVFRHKLPKTSYQVLYTVLCRQEDGFKITSTAAKACSNYLLNDIKKAKPKLIVATSTECLKSLGIKHLSLKKNLSEIHEWNGIPLVITLHPSVTTMIRQNSSGAFWGDDFYYLISKDIEKIGKILRGEAGPQDPPAAIERMRKNGQLQLCDTLEKVEKLADYICAFGSERIISWDTETTGLDPWAKDARFLTHQFGVTGPDGVTVAYIVPLWHRENTFFNPDDAWPHVRRILESPVTKVGHHGKFDLKYTKVTTGVDVCNYKLDTMYALHSLCSGLQGTYSLKKAVWDWVPELGLGGYEDHLFAGMEVLDTTESDSDAEE